ncbi:MAG: cell division protein FtsA [Anaerolineae bacterium]|nr:cell division protein FtsA [Anaerolineae bacterium]MDW8101868.1 cell division protein FtsA [Anaerolineae bacterium]
MARITAAIDVGTTKVCTLIAEVEEKEEEAIIQIIGFGNAPSRGMKKGSVVNISQLAQSVMESVEQAEKLAGLTVSRAYVSLTGSHIFSMSSRGMIALHRRPGGITAEDVARVIEAASAISIPYSQEIIHVIPRHFTVDGQPGIQDPTGMEGSRLEAEVLIVTASGHAVNNLRKCLKEVGIEPEKFILAALASGEAVLTPSEKEMGVILADIGGGTTDIAIYMDGSVLFTSSLEIGGNMITSDIAFGLRMPFSSAEEIKKKYGCALAEEVGEDEGIEAMVFGSPKKELISRRFMAEIIQARVEEMFDFLYREAQKTGYAGLLPAGLVLCGGTAEIKGIDELGKRYLEMPVRVGKPSGVQGLVEMLGSPAYATAVGLLLWPVRQRILKIRGTRKSWKERAIEWLKTLLPY